MKTEDLARHIDHTALDMKTTLEMIFQLCREAQEWSVASICIPPSYVRTGAAHLQKTAVHVGTVIGFPFGYTAPSVKIHEAVTAQNDGADEIDIVMHLGKFKAGQFLAVEEDLEGVIRATPGMIHKIIIETGVLTREEKINASRLVLNVGADFIKTSTGFGPGGATSEDVRLLSQAGKGRIRVKASGGIRDLETALAMIHAGADRIGTRSTIQILSESKAADES